MGRAKGRVLWEGYSVNAGTTRDLRSVASAERNCGSSHPIVAAPSVWSLVIAYVSLFLLCRMMSVVRTRITGLTPLTQGASGHWQGTGGVADHEPPARLVPRERYLPVLDLIVLESRSTRDPK